MKKKMKKKIEIVPQSTYPNMLVMVFLSFQEQQNILFTNATVWTNEEDGILRETDVLVKNGKDMQVRFN